MRSEKKVRMRTMERISWMSRNRLKHNEMSSWTFKKMTRLTDSNNSQGQDAASDRHHITKMRWLSGNATLYVRKI